MPADAGVVGPGQARSARFSDEELLARLSQLLESKGFLSGLIIDEVDEMPSTSVYRKRFGSLLRAYQLVGYSPSRDFRYIETNRALRAMHPDVVASVVEGLHAAGGHAEVDENGLLMEPMSTSRARASFSSETPRSMARTIM